MIDHKLRQRLFQASVRVDKMQFIGTEDPSEPTDLVKGWFEDGEHEEADFLVGRDNWLLTDPDTENCVDTALEYFLDRYVMEGGFMAQISRPVPLNPNFREDGSLSSYSASWGMYWTKVFYAPTLEALFEASIEWADRTVKDELDRIRAEKGVATHV